MIMPKAWVSDESVIRNEKSPSENRWYAPSTKTARHIHEAAPMLPAVLPELPLMLSLDITSSIIELA